MGFLCQGVVKNTEKIKKLKGLTFQTILMKAIFLACSPIDD